MDMDQKALPSHPLHPSWGGLAGPQSPKDVHLLGSLCHVSSLCSLPQWGLHTGGILGLFCGRAECTSLGTFPGLRGVRHWLFHFAGLGVAQIRLVQGTATQRGPGAT